MNDNESRADVFHSDTATDWCAGCGDHGILKALEKALFKLARRPDQVAVFGGIGCSGKLPYYLTAYGIHTLHGRALPIASGAKLANPDLTVVVVSGDGDALSIGAGHFVNAGRRNIDLTLILCNNGVYGLTKGQAAPTLRSGEQTRSMARPNWQDALNPAQLALTSGYTWIGRGYAYAVPRLADLMAQAMGHPGLACLEVLQPCPMYNDLYTRDWYAGKDLTPPHPRLYDLQEEGHDPSIPFGSGDDLRRERMLACFALTQEAGERIPTGVLLRDLSRPALNLRSVPSRLRITDDTGIPAAKLDGVMSRLAAAELPLVSDPEIRRD